MTSGTNPDSRAEFFKSLGHPARLLILNLIREKPRHGEELAAILHLKPATISHHLSKLTDAGLLKREKAQYYQIYSLVPDALSSTLGELISLRKENDTMVDVQVDAYKQKVLKNFFRQGRLINIPAQLKKYLIVLEKLSEEFEPGQEYSEREVNQILVEFHDDVAMLRRGLVEEKFMQRDKGIYRRIDVEK